MFGIFKQLFTSGTNNDELTTALTNGAYLVDVRTPQEFSSGSVKGAVNIPLNTVSTKINLFKGKANIVVFCRSGNRSSQAKSILQQNGFTNVYNGGTWQNVSKLLESK